MELVDTENFTFEVVVNPFTNYDEIPKINAGKKLSLRLKNGAPSPNQPPKHGEVHLGICEHKELKTVKVNVSNFGKSITRELKVIEGTEVDIETVADDGYFLSGFDIK